MPIFWDRVWENHKGTESHAFKTADALTLNHQYLKETAPGSYLLTAAITKEESLGYAVGLPRAGVPAGTEIELMFGEWVRPVSAGPGSGVITVTDDGNLVVVVDNTDPNNPVVTFQGVFVAMSIVGTGQNGIPLTLDNDQLSPGAFMCYSTDGSGNKGWFPLPTGGLATLTDNGGGSYTFDNGVDPPLTFFADLITAFAWNSTTGDLTITTNLGSFTVTIPKATVTDNGNGTFTFSNGIDPDVTWNTLNGLLSINSVQGDGLLGTEFQLVGDVLAPGNNYYYGTDGTGTKGFFLLPAPGITDVLIGRTLHVSSNGNDGTAIPNSLVNKYLTIQAAHAASTGVDTIVIWPGQYTIPASLTIDFLHAQRFYAYVGTVIITPALGSPAFLIDNAVHFSFLGNSSWLVRSQIFAPLDPITDICYVQFEADNCGQFGVTGFVADISSMAGSISIYHMTDLAITCEGWCQIDMSIDKNEFTGSAIYNIANITSNNGLAFNVQYGCSRFQLRGRRGKYAYIYGAYGPGFLQGMFFSGSSGGTRDDRHVKIVADLYVFDGPAFNINECTWTWEGSGFSDKDPLPINDQLPFFMFDNTGNTDFYFEHVRGTVRSEFDNTLLRFFNNGTVKLNGNYYTFGTTYPMIEYSQAPGAGSRLILNGDYQNNGPTKFIDVFDQSFGTPFLLVFGIATFYCQQLTALVADSTFGVPTNIFITHSLVSNTNYNGAALTDVSVGNRHYVDAGFTNYIPSEHIR